MDHQHERQPERPSSNGQSPAHLLLEQPGHPVESQALSSKTEPRSTKTLHSGSTDQQQIVPTQSQQQNVLHNLEHRPTLATLPFELIQKIMDLLNPIDLGNVSETNGQLCRVIMGMLRQVGRRIIGRVFAEDQNGQIDAVIMVASLRDNSLTKRALIKNLRDGMILPPGAQIVNDLPGATLDAMDVSVRRRDAVTAVAVISLGVRLGASADPEGGLVENGITAGFSFGGFPDVAIQLLAKGLASESDVARTFPDAARFGYADYITALIPSLSDMPQFEELMLQVARVASECGQSWIVWTVKHYVDADVVKYLLEAAVENERRNLENHLHLLGTAG